MCHFATVGAVVMGKIWRARANPGIYYTNPGTFYANRGSNEANLSSNDTNLSSSDANLSLNDANLSSNDAIKRKFRAKKIASDLMPPPE